MSTQHNELHAAIAAYLRAQPRPLMDEEFDATPHVGGLVRYSEERILAIWHERVGVPYCRYCGKPITEGDDAFDVEQMRAARACVDHFAPF